VQGASKGQEIKTMTTDLKTKPASEPVTFRPNPTQAPTKPGLPEKKADEKVDQVADRMAHKGAKAEQEFDNENSKPFSK
jgi:hypothetical protein